MRRALALGVAALGLVTLSPYFTHDSFHYMHLAVRPEGGLRATVPVGGVTCADSHCRRDYDECEYLPRDLLEDGIRRYAKT